MSAIRKETSDLLIGEHIKIPGNNHVWEVVAIMRTRTRLNMQRRISYKLTLKDCNNPDRIQNFTFAPETVFVVVDQRNQENVSV